jgi:DNA-binding phage protein
MEQALIELVIQQLRVIRYRPTIASISRESGVSRTALYVIMRTGTMSERDRRRLSRVLQSDHNRPSHNPSSPTGS